MIVVLAWTALAAQLRRVAAPSMPATYHRSKMRAVVALVENTVLPHFASPGTVAGLLQRSPQALGYLFGMHQATLKQPHGADAPTQAEWVFHLGCRMLFGQRHAQRLLIEAVELTRDGAFRIGCLQGARELDRYFGGDFPPDSLLSLLELTVGRFTEPGAG